MSDRPHDAMPSLAQFVKFPIIFRTFKLAVQPGKIMLAVAGLLLTYFIGTCLDGIWAAGDVRVYSGEIGQYTSGAPFHEWKEQRARADDQFLAGMLVQQGACDTLDKAREDLQQDRSFAVGVLRARIEEEYRLLIDLDERLAAENERIEELPEDERAAARETIEERMIEAVRQSRTQYLALHAEIDELDNQRVFGQWITYQLHFSRTAIGALLRGNLATRVMPETDVRVHPTNPFQCDSFVGSLSCMAGAVCWMMRVHPWYFICFTLLNLAVWSVMGGGLCRMAAMEATLDQRISVGKAVAFSREKWREFYLAPIVPLAFVLLVGLLLWLGGIGTAVPVLGEIVGPLVFPLALLGGFVIALVAIGATGGAVLMWPTIAVEGSDSFDAVSRSFSYVYNRPWRSIVYALMLAVYGSLCYVFVRFFVFLILACTHLFVSYGVGVFADRPEAGEDMNKFDVMWAMPSFDNLRPQFEMINLGRAEPLGAAILWIFVSLVVLALHAFVISFLFSGFTFVYLLLRQVVDATDIEDIYTEEAEEEAIEMVAATAETAAEPPAAEQPSPDSEPPPPADT